MIDRRGLLSAFASGVAALGGCNSLDGEPAETVTPAPVADGESPAPKAATGPDPAALERDHRAALTAEGGYLVRRTGSAVYPDLVRRSRALFRAGVNATQFRFDVAQPDGRMPMAAGRASTVELWFSAAGSFKRVRTAEEGAELSRLRGNDALEAREIVRAIVSPGVRLVLTAFPRLDVESRTDGWRLDGRAREQVAGLPAYPGDSSSRDARLTLRVAGSGLVEWYTLRYAATASDGADVVRNGLVEFAADRPLRIDRPGWVDAVTEG